MKYLKIEGAGRPEAEGRHHRAARQGEEDWSPIWSDRSSISDARCVLVLKLKFEAQCDDQSPMCSVAMLPDAEVLSIGCCLWCALFWFCFTWWIYCSSFFRLGCNSVYWVLVLVFFLESVGLLPSVIC